jgi:hypothetical protein
MEDIMNVKKAPTLSFVKKGLFMNHELVYIGRKHGMMLREKFNEMIIRSLTQPFLDIHELHLLLIFLVLTDKEITLFPG